MKNLICLALVSLVLASFVGCSDSTTASTSSSAPAPMATDSKDMKPANK